MRSRMAMCGRPAPNGPEKPSGLFTPKPAKIRCFREAHFGRDTPADTPSFTAWAASHRLAPMCNRARNRHEPHTIHERFGARWLADRPMDNRFNPVELVPRGRAWVVRENDRGRGVDVMAWDVAGGQASWPMTNVRNLDRPQWRRLAERPANRCLVPLSEFCEWTPEPVDLGDGKRPVRGEMWFEVIDQPLFAVAGVWQATAIGDAFAMVTCPPNDLVAPIHPKAMITILEEADWDRWLRGTYDDVVALQRPYPAERMAVRGPEFPTRSGARPSRARP